MDLSGVGVPDVPVDPHDLHLRGERSAVAPSKLWQRPVPKPAPRTCPLNQPPSKPDSGSGSNSFLIAAPRKTVSACLGVSCNAPALNNILGELAALPRDQVICDTVSASQGEAPLCPGLPRREKCVRAAQSDFESRWQERQGKGKAPTQ